ncbi:glycoside hydrolase family 9 protein [uncultured Duncaniella sp.]|uniref:glycoside hydrolase family 9 protein n=1 Tax=uncultured Duncaniella sp. TaxID=2768039 RepID=UPI0026F3E09B|nr:glycoside hydrolase family 9 protein [uncultured Duncaniella sp.]
MRIIYSILILLAILLPFDAECTRLLGVKVVDKDYLMVHFRDGEVRYRDNGTGRSAYLGHAYAMGDDSLVVFGHPLDIDNVQNPSLWKVSSVDDKDFSVASPDAVWRKSKPMNTDSRLISELDHWIFLKLPKSMKQGCNYTVNIPRFLGADTDCATVCFDIWNATSESIHVNQIGYSTGQRMNVADLYLWLGDGGQRDYDPWIGKSVYLYSPDTGIKKRVGAVKKWKTAEASVYEAGERNLTGSAVWSVDFPGCPAGYYRLVVEDVGCSMDFKIAEDVYYEPFRNSVRGYYYMRLDEPVDTPRVVPVPRQPQFISSDAPDGFKIYKTDLHPWHPDWKQCGGDVWDEPHFRKAEMSLFWKHRLSGNPIATGVRGGHSDAFDWDRHLAHVSNIYDMLLPFILTHGKLSDDNLGIRESGNGIPDLLDEARNEVDFFLSIRDGDGYSQGVTNPSADWSVMFQAGCTTMAAWANAANCAVMAEAFRINGNKYLSVYYAKEAVKAFRYAERQSDQQSGDILYVGDVGMRTRDFKQMAAAFLYNITADRRWEKILVRESCIRDNASPLFKRAVWNDPESGYCQLWGAAAYISCPHKRHFPRHYENLVSSINRHADSYNVRHFALRPSRRVANDPRHRTSENLHLVMLAPYVARDESRRELLEEVMYAEAGWGLGRNPSNTVEMTGLGQRYITDIYSTGGNDGVPGTHPGQTPFNGTETWSENNGGDARILLNRCYPSWAGWPQQESFFNQRYIWVNSEFTPRETMRGKMALLAYLYGIRG